MHIGLFWMPRQMLSVFKDQSAVEAAGNSKLSLLWRKEEVLKTRMSQIISSSFVVVFRCDFVLFPLIRHIFFRKSTSENQSAFKTLRS